LTHFGMWMQPERQRPLGPALTPPLDALYHLRRVEIE